MQRLIWAVLLLLANSLSAQWDKIAKPYEDKLNYYSAANAYKKAIDTGNTEDFIKFTRVLFNQGKYRETYENYLILHHQNKLKNIYDLQAFRTCKSILHGGDLNEFDQQFRDLFVEAGVKGFQQNIDQNNSQYLFQNECFNSKEFEDLAPCKFEDYLLFTSSRPSVNGDLGKYNYNNQPYYDVFAVKDCEVLSLSKLKKKLPKEINTYLHDGPAFYASISQLLFVTRNIEVSKGTLPMGIFMAKKENNRWTKFSGLPFNSKTHTVQHPYFDDSSQTLYFSSNMPGGLGGFDLYKAQFLNGVWSNPVNLGSDINSPLDEVFPSFYGGNLYFSSNGFRASGGLDVMIYSQGKLYEMKGLNTPWDDFGICFINDSLGLLTTNRIHGFGHDDIIKFERKSPIKEVVIEAYAQGDKWGKPERSKLKLNIIDDQSEETLKSPIVKFQIKNKQSGIVSELTLVLDSIQVVLGHFTNDSLFDIDVKVEHPDYETASVEFKDLKSENNFIDLGKIRMKRNAKYKLRYIALHPIYFDLDKFNIRKDASLTLDTIASLLKEYPTIKLKLRAYTDSRATDKYNQKLSQNRAKSTFNYLIRKGIKASRLVYGGYGENNLVNDCGDDKKCEENYHQLNRRTEFEIIQM